MTGSWSESINIDILNILKKEKRAGSINLIHLEKSIVLGWEIIEDYMQIGLKIKFSLWGEELPLKGKKDSKCLKKLKIMMSMFIQILSLNFRKVPLILRVPKKERLTSL